MSSEDLCCQMQIPNDRNCQPAERGTTLLLKEKFATAPRFHKPRKWRDRTSSHRAFKIVRGVNLQIFPEKERVVPLSLWFSHFLPYSIMLQHLQIRTQILHKLYKSMNAHFTLPFYT